MEAGSLGFSVLLYTVLAIAGVGILMFRRLSPACGKAELGGPTWSANLSALIMISLWLVFIIVASLQTYGVIKADF